MNSPRFSRLSAVFSARALPIWMYFRVARVKSDDCRAFDEAGVKKVGEREEKKHLRRRFCRKFSESGRGPIYMGQFSGQQARFCATSKQEAATSIARSARRLPKVGAEIRKKELCREARVAAAG